MNTFLFGFMPESEWDLYTRDSRIEINGNEIGHPIEFHQANPPYASIVHRNHIFWDNRIAHVPAVSRMLSLLNNSGASPQKKH